MEQEYECIGICEPDPDLAYCTGCGRPWAEVVREQAGASAPAGAAAEEGGS